MQSVIRSCALVAVVAHAKGVADAPEPYFKQPKVTKMEVPPQPFCKDGSSYGPQGCAVYETAEAIIDCPHPYKMTDKGVCTTITHGESVTTCPKGSYLDGHDCVTEETQPINTFCSKGVLNKDGCLVEHEPHVVAPKIKTPHLTCPKGYKLSHGTCVMVIAEDAALVCDKGFELTGHKCVAIASAPLECKAGNLSKDQCIVTDIAQPEPVCTKGSKMTKTGCVMIQTSEAVLVCEKGYTLEGHGCVARILIQAVSDDKKGAPMPFKCMGDLDDKGNCYQTHHADADLVCEKGLELVGHKCVAEIQTAPEFVCPHGYGAAATGTKADCLMTKVYQATCPHGFDYTDKGCIQVTHSKPAQICPKGTDLEHGSCVAISTVEPTPVCPDEYPLSKEGCVKPGYSVPGASKVHAPSVSCPKGYALDKKNGVCLNLVKSAPAIICEKGFTLDGHRCTAVHQVAPVSMCPHGFGADKSGVCSRTTFDRPHFICPKDSEDHGSKCFIVAPVGDKKFDAPVPVAVDVKKYDAPVVAPVDVKKYDAPVVAPVVVDDKKRLR